MLSKNIHSWVIKVVSKRTEEVAKEIFKGVVKRSPVYTGSFRASWRLAVDKVDESMTLDLNRLPSLPLAAAEVPTFVLDKSKLQHVYISNFVPHAHFVEFEGTKYSPPAAVVRLTLALVSKQ